MGIIYFPGGLFITYQKCIGISWKEENSRISLSIIFEEG